jgi:DNA-binding response OmpR family regulator
LCDVELATIIDDQIVHLADGSPRTALRLASSLLHAHCRQIELQDFGATDAHDQVQASQDVALFAKETWEQVKRAWSAEHGFPVLRVDETQKTVHLDQNEITSDFSRQVLLVLESLYHHRDQVCEKDALIEEAWEGGLASDEMLAQSIRRLRRTLEEYVPNAEYVETVRGIGYRLYPRGKLKTD